MRRILGGLFFLSAVLRAQPVQQVLPNPDCQIFFSLSSTGATSPVFNNLQQGCTSWSMVYVNSGFSPVSVTLQSAANNAGVPGAFSTGFPVQQTVVSGSNPGTSTTAAFLWVQGVNAFVRVLLTSTGSGVVNGAVYGWRIPNAASSGSGGGGIVCLSGDVTAGTGSCTSATVVGLETVPFCTGFTPTNGQFVEYTTGGSPNPCYTAATPSGAGTVTSSGSPVSGNIAKFSTATNIVPAVADTDYAAPPGTMVTAAPGATPVVNFTTGAITGGSTIGPAGTAWIILSANVTSSTFTFTPGKQYTVCVVQPASGGPYTFATPTNIVGWPPVLARTANGFNCLTGFYTTASGSGSNLLAIAYTNSYGSCSEVAAPSAPASGELTWCDSTRHAPMTISSALGVAFGQVQDKAATAGQFVTSIVNGIPILAAPSAIPLSELATQANATMVANTSGGTAVPTAVAIPASTTAVKTDANGNFVAATYQGNGAKVQLSTGTTTTNDCTKFDANGNTVDAGAACGAGGGGGGVGGWSGLPLTFATTATQYAPPQGGALTSATETVVSVGAPAAATISGLYVTLSAQLGASATLQVTLEDGTGNPTALTCTTASGGKSCSDITDSVNVSKGDLLSLKLVSSGTVTAGLPQIVVNFAVGTSGVGLTAIYGNTGPTVNPTAHNIATSMTCADSSGSATAQSCSTATTFAPATGDSITYTTTTASGATLTVNVNSSSAAAVYKWGGSAAVTTGDIPANKPINMTFDAAGHWDVDDIGNTPVISLNGATGAVVQNTTRVETGSYNPVSGDCGNIIIFNDASNPAVVFPQAGTTGFASGCQITVINNNMGGIVTETATTSVFQYNGSTGRANWFQGLDNTAVFTSDGTNWNVQTSFPQVLYNNSTDSCIAGPATANQTIGYTGSTISCTQATSATAWGPTFTFPANFFSTNTQVRVREYYAETTGSAPTTVIATIKLGGAAVAATVAAAPCNAGASLINMGCHVDFELQGTAPVSGSAVVAASVISVKGWSALTTWFGTFATNGTLAMTETGIYSANTAGNWIDWYRTSILWEVY